MYAIIETGGKQYWVRPGETVKVETLADAAPGKEFTFNALWAAQDAKEGTEPVTSTKARVVAEVVAELRAAKIIVFKRRRKKAYKRLHGHRQNQTEIRIKSINFN